MNFSWKLVPNRLNEILCGTINTQKIYKLVFSYNTNNDQYIENLLFCPHCLVFMLDIRAIEELEQTPAYMVALSPYQEMMKEEKKCSNCKRLLRVPFYRKNMTEEQKRKKEYIYQTRVCRSCLVLQVIPETEVLENFRFHIEVNL